MPDKKLTDSEIVKALEECLAINKKHFFFISNENKIQGLSIADILDLINRLQAENEELKETVKVLRIGVEQAHLIRKDDKSPFNLLKAEIKAEAYKECIDMVKKKGVKIGVDEICIFESTLNNLLKEKVGEDNANL